MGGMECYSIGLMCFSLLETKRFHMEVFACSKHKSSLRTDGKYVLHKNKMNTVYSLLQNPTMFNLTEDLWHYLSQSIFD